MANLHSISPHVDPPLRAVRTFEAFARHGSVAAAARELGISASAISHQLGLLENFLDTPLTMRQGRSLSLSEQGRIYYQSIRSAFAVLRSATDQLHERAAIRQITVSLIPLFGTEFLIPRLGEFLELHPDVDVNVTYANHRSYPSDAADISIRFGSGQWSGYRSEKLLSGAMSPFCSPEFLTRHGAQISDDFFSDVPLLHDEERDSWVQWLDVAGKKARKRMHGPLFEDGLLTLAATLAGHGCALLRPPLVAHYVNNNELLCLSEAMLDDGRDYYLCCRAGIEFSAESLSLYSWIKKICGNP